MLDYCHAMKADFVWFDQCINSFSLKRYCQNVGTILSKWISCYAFTIVFVRRRGVVVIIYPYIHSTKSQLSFCVSSNPTRSVSGICTGENLWQWSLLGIRRKCLSSVNPSRKQFISITIVVIGTCFTHV